MRDDSGSLLFLLFWPNCVQLKVKITTKREKKQKQAIKLHVKKSPVLHFELKVLFHHFHFHCCSSVRVSSILSRAVAPKYIRKDGIRPNRPNHPSIQIPKHLRPTRKCSKIVINFMRSDNSRNEKPSALMHACDM